MSGKNMFARLAVPLLIIVLSVVFVVIVPKIRANKPQLDGFTVNGRIYYFMHTRDQIMNVPVYPNDSSIYDFFRNGNNFTVVFDGSNPEDNGLFAKEGYNIVRRIVRYYGDMGIFKSFETKMVQDLNGSEGKLVWLHGPHTGGTDFGVFVNNTTIIVSGRTPEEFSLAAERLSFSALGLSQQNSSAVPATQ